MRGLVVRQGQVLLLKKDGYNSGGVRYALPGGGQEAGESLEDALRRECLEEIDCTVTVGALLAVKDFIKRRDTEPPSWRHVLEFLFRCEPPADYRPRSGPAPDKHQVAVVWLPLSRLHQVQLFPQYLSELIPHVLSRPQPCYQGRFVDPGFGEDT